MKGVETQHVQTAYGVHLRKKDIRWKNGGKKTDSSQAEIELITFFFLN